MKAFQNTVQNFMHHSKNTYSPNLISGSQLKCDASTKPSTLNEEHEPVPSFLKALNFYQSELFENEDETFDDGFSDSSVGYGGIITESSVGGCKAGTLYSVSGTADTGRSKSDNYHMSTDGVLNGVDSENSPMMVMESFGELSLKNQGNSSSKDLSFGKK